MVMATTQKYACYLKCVELPYTVHHSVLSVKQNAICFLMSVKNFLLIIIHIEANYFRHISLSGTESETDGTWDLNKDVLGFVSRFLTTAEAVT